MLITGDFFGKSVLTLTKNTLFFKKVLLEFWIFFYWNAVYLNMQYVRIKKFLPKLWEWDNVMSKKSAYCVAVT